MYNSQAHAASDLHIEPTTIGSVCVLASFILVRIIIILKYTLCTMQGSGCKSILALISPTRTLGSANQTTPEAIQRAARQGKEPDTSLLDGYKLCWTHSVWI